MAMRVRQAAVCAILLFNGRLSRGAWRTGNYQPDVAGQGGLASPYILLARPWRAGSLWAASLFRRVGALTKVLPGYPRSVRGSSATFNPAGTKWYRPTLWVMHVRVK